MIDISSLGRCCYECPYVDLKVGENTVFLGSDYCNHVTIKCRHDKVCSTLEAEKEALHGEDLQPS